MNFKLSFCKSARSAAAAWTPPRQAGDCGLYLMGTVSCSADFTVMLPPAAVQMTLGSRRSQRALFVSTLVICEELPVTLVSNRTWSRWLKRNWNRGLAC
jgi:hypothetical protein